MSTISPTFDELLKFMATATSKGWVGSTSGNAIQSTLKRVKPVLEEQELSNVEKVDVKALIRRFQNLNRDVGPSSLASYASRISSAIRMFSAYRANPVAWKPRSSGGASPKATRRKPEQKLEIKPDQGDVDTLQPPNGDTLSYPFPLREGMLIRIMGLPRDLSQADVKRIARFLEVLCVD